MSASGPADPSMGWSCKECVGGVSRSGSTRIPANDELRRQRGNCGGPFPTRFCSKANAEKPDLREAKIDEFGIAYVTGDRILDAPRFAKTRWTSCPLAWAGRPGCPDPKSPRWLHKVTEAASWMNEGGQLADIAPDAPDAFRAAVATARRAAASARQADSAAARAMGAAADAAAGKGRRR